MYKQDLDECRPVHAYSPLRRCHNNMATMWCSARSRRVVSSWFPDLPEAAFFRDAVTCARPAIKEMGALVRMRVSGTLQEAH